MRMRLFLDLVISQSNGTPPTNFWIGVNLLLTSKWTWTTNDAALYTNWAPDEPIDPSNFDCGSVRTDGSNLWKKDLCYSALPFVCTADTIDVPSENSVINVKAFSGDSPCDPEYTQYENQCFRVSWTLGCTVALPVIHWFRQQIALLRSWPILPRSKCHFAKNYHSWNAKFCCGFSFRRTIIYLARIGMQWNEWNQWLPVVGRYPSYLH